MCIQGPLSQSAAPLGREIVQRWTAVPRAGHTGSEITHSIYGPLRVWGLTDLGIQQQTGRQLAVQSFSQGQPPSITVSSVRLKDEFVRTLLLFPHFLLIHVDTCNSWGSLFIFIFGEFALKRDLRLSGQHVYWDIRIAKFHSNVAQSALQGHKTFKQEWERWQMGEKSDQK